jgi:hypothetical protein
VSPHSSLLSGVSAAPFPGAPSRNTAVGRRGCRSRIDGRLDVAPSERPTAVGAADGVPEEALLVESEDVQLAVVAYRARDCAHTADVRIASSTDRVPHVAPPERPAAVRPAKRVPEAGALVDSEQLKLAGVELSGGARGACDGGDRADIGVTAGDNRVPYIPPAERPTAVRSTYRVPKDALLVGGEEMQLAIRPKIFDLLPTPSFLVLCGLSISGNIQQRVIGRLTRVRPAPSPPDRENRAHPES